MSGSASTPTSSARSALAAGLVEREGSRWPHGEPGLRLCLLRSERIIFLGTPIDDEIANLTIAEPLHLESDDRQGHLALHQLPGGSVYAGLAMYDTMQFVKPAIATISVGLAMSLGAERLAVAREFAISTHTVEVTGTCADCR